MYYVVVHIVNTLARLVTCFLKESTNLKSVEIPYKELTLPYDGTVLNLPFLSALGTASYCTKR